MVDYSKKYCDEHKVIVEQERKKSYKDYKMYRSDKREQTFYNSKEWKQLRLAELGYFNGLDIFQYYVNHRVINADLVHHIVEVKDDWNKRLDIPNLITINKNETHNLIHAEYNKGGTYKTNMQELLRELIKKYNKEFGGVE